MVHATRVPNIPSANLVQIGIGGWAGKKAGMAVARERFWQHASGGRRRTILVLGAVVTALAVVVTAIALRDPSDGQYWVGFSGDDVAVYRGPTGDVGQSTLVERTLLGRGDVRDHESRLADGIGTQSLEEARQTAKCSLLSLPPTCLFGASATPALSELPGASLDPARRSSRTISPPTSRLVAGGERDRHEAVSERNVSHPGEEAGVRSVRHPRDSRG